MGGWLPGWVSLTHEESEILLFIPDPRERTFSSAYWRRQSSFRYRRALCFVLMSGFSLFLFFSFLALRLVSACGLLPCQCEVYVRDMPLHQHRGDKRHKTQIESLNLRVGKIAHECPLAHCRWGRSFSAKTMHGLGVITDAAMDGPCTSFRQAIMSYLAT